MSAEEECNCPPPGLPAYMGTFADLMALLMCFFVLLLSFSEMDVLKFKQIAGSMNFAFGVQNKVEVKDIPKGTSIIAQEFSPGKPTPTVIEAIMQHTVEITQESLDFDEPVEEDPEEGDGDKSDTGEGQNTNIGQGEKTSTSEKEISEQVERLAMKIAEMMSEELNSGQIELLAKDNLVVIRIRESGSFGSGSDRIESEFLPVLRKISKILEETKGEVRVAGHTDNLPIDTERFRSNWELSGGRAGSVVRELLKNPKLQRDRFVITGYADTRPLDNNTTAAGRAKNRRVEVVIVQGDGSPSKILGIDGIE